MRMTVLPGTLHLLDLPIKAYQRAQSCLKRGPPIVRISPAHPVWYLHICVSPIVPESMFAVKRLCKTGRTVHGWDAYTQQALHAIGSSRHSLISQDM